MQRIKFIKNYKTYRRGDILVETPNVAFGLIDKGVAIKSKDMSTNDYTAKVKRGNTKFKRTNISRGR